MLPKSVFMLLASIVSTTTATYTLVQDYSGDAFYQNFDFFSDPDPTEGHVEYQTLEAANTTGLAGFISTGDAKRAIFMSVDSKAVAPNGRGSVRVSSKQSFNHALVIADILHMPGGICGTWPAFWMLGPDWPTNGEIDIVEGVNDQTKNLMTLHSSAGPVLSANSEDAFMGSVLTSNCDVNAPDQFKNAGCSVEDASDLSFGTGFNNASGGVFATEWTSSFINIWFFPRGSFPANIASDAPTPDDTWGTPRSVFQGDFDLDDNFKDLQIVFDTTFCGAWAGQTWNTLGNCATLAPTCDEFVTNNPLAFNEAFWAINTLQVFQDDGQPNNAVTNTTEGPGTPEAVNGTSTATLGADGTMTSTSTVTNTFVSTATAVATATPSDGPVRRAGAYMLDTDTPPVPRLPRYKAHTKQRRGGAVLPL